MPKKKTYEEAIARLEEITSQLEKGGIPLEQSLKLFEEGTKLSAYGCDRDDTHIFTYT